MYHVIVYQDAAELLDDDVNDRTAQAIVKLAMASKAQVAVWRLDQ